MSPPTPAVPAPAPAVPAPAEPARPARWLDRLTGLLLLATVTLLAGAFTPPVLRALGAGATHSPVMRADRLPLPYGERPEAQPAPHPRRGNFEFDFSERDEDEDDPHRAPPAVPRIPRLDGDVPSPEPAGGSLVMGVARRPFSLFADPDPESAPLGKIEAGNQVMVMKESGDWALVIRTGADGVLMGWARRSEIAVR